MKCRICHAPSHKAMDGRILGRYNISYFHCNSCKFLQTENPYWLEESYSSSINIEDTGILERSRYFSKITTGLIRLLFGSQSNFLDYAGGFGIFTRMMRDAGFSFYWKDLYSMNLVARGFEYVDQDIELITSFEAFEHFVDPIKELEQMLKISTSIFFSTELLPSGKLPEINSWWYYGLSHGQHISFYSKHTLEFLAKKYSLNLYSNGKNLHLLTSRKLNSLAFRTISYFSCMIPLEFLKIGLRTKIIEDMESIIDHK